MSSPSAALKPSRRFDEVVGRLATINGFRSAVGASTRLDELDVIGASKQIEFARFDRMRSSGRNEVEQASGSSASDPRLVGPRSSIDDHDEPPRAPNHFRDPHIPFD